MEETFYIQSVPDWHGSAFKENQGFSMFIFLIYNKQSNVERS